MRWLTDRTALITYSAIATEYTPRAFVTVTSRLHIVDLAIWSMPADDTWSHRRRGVPWAGGGDEANTTSASGSFRLSRRLSSTWTTSSRDETALRRALCSAESSKRLSTRTGRVNRHCSQRSLGRTRGLLRCHDKRHDRRRPARTACDHTIWVHIKCDQCPVNRGY